MALVHGSVPEYNPATMNWAIYERRVTNYLVANNVDAAERRCAILLLVLGDTAVQTVTSLVAPTRPEEKTFDELLEVLRKHYGEPQKSAKAILRQNYEESQVSAEAIARLEFGRLRQTEGQSLDEFVVQLRLVAEDCNFGEMLSEYLRDKLISGVHSGAMRKEMLKIKENRTFESCYAAGRDCEKLAAVLKKFSSQGSAETSAGAVQQKTKFKQQKGTANIDTIHSGSAGRGLAKRSSALGGSHSHLAKPHQEEPKSSSPICFRCGRRGHFPSDCVYKQYNCYQCGERGHKSLVCRSRFLANAD